MIRLRKAVSEGCLLLDIEATDLETVFSQVLHLGVAQGVISAEDRGAVEKALIERERQFSTAIGHSVAVPHAYLDVLSEPAIFFVRLAHPLNLGAPDGIPTQFLFVLLGPSTSAVEHLDTLTEIARLLSDDEFRYEVRIAKSRDELLACLDHFVSRHRPLPLPPETVIPEGLEFTGRPLGGLLQDLRRRLPHYGSDFRDGLYRKCAAAVLFLFFGILAPTVAFGGLLSVLTEGQIGVTEMLVAGGVGGCLYALFSGQPLTIIATTGPIVVFLGILYQITQQFELPFLPVFGWIGLWTSLFTLILAATDVTAIVRFCTRFTDEIFATLIAAIYISQAIGKLFTLGTSDEIARFDSLVGLLLGLGTFYVAISLVRFRRSHYLFHGIREFLADFGPAIAIATMTIVALNIPDIHLTQLQVPDTLKPTADRSWTVDLFAVPQWVWWGSAIPAIFATILVFLDQNITVRLVNNPDNHLAKGPGYHLDLAVVGILIGAFAFFGLPWLVAATVRSLSHLRSVAVTETIDSGEGPPREHILHVHENRLTGLAIHGGILLSVFILPVLKLVPMPVLYGLFLYMGIVSLGGIQFVERLKLWLTEPGLYPQSHFVRRVPNRTIHLYTMVQLVCLAVLWYVKSSEFAVVFPLLIALLVPIRLMLNRFFPQEHLAALDADTEPTEEEMHWFS